MKYLFFAGVSLLTIVSINACDKSGPTTATAPTVVTTPSPITTPELKVVNWGPQSAKLGTVPNKQPNGTMGIWISVVKPSNFGEAQVIFGDQLANATSVQESAINAAIANEQLKQVGSKEIVIKQISTGKSFVVGTFKIEP